MKRTIALIFAFLSLALELFISIKSPSVESITACVFSAVIIIALFCIRTVTLTDVSPKGARPNDRVLKLANEIAPYVKEKDGKISLRILK